MLVKTQKTDLSVNADTHNLTTKLKVTERYVKFKDAE